MLRLSALIPYSFHPRLDNLKGIGCCANVPLTSGDHDDGLMEGQLEAGHAHRYRARAVTIDRVSSREGWIRDRATDVHGGAAKEAPCSIEMSDARLSEQHRRGRKPRELRYEGALSFHSVSAIQARERAASLAVLVLRVDHRQNADTMLHRENPNNCGG